MRNKKRWIWGVLSFIGSCLFLFSCAMPKAEERKEQEITTIPVIFRANLETGEKENEDLVEKFNEKYKDKYYVDAEWVMETEEEYRKNLKKLNVTDELPAIVFEVQILPSFYQMMLKDERLIDLSPYVESDEELREAIAPEILEKCKDENGKMYFCPAGSPVFNYTGVFWNKELFAKAGIEEFPKTWEEFWDVCDKLKENGITPLSLHTDGTGWSPMLIATAEVASTKEGKEFMEQSFPSSYNNKVGLRIAKNLKKMFQYTTEDAIHSDFDLAHSNFVEGKTAMLVNGYWEIERFNDKIYDKLAFSPFPENETIFSVEQLSWSITSTYSNEVRQGAIEFLKFRVLEQEKEREVFLREMIDKKDVKGDYARAVSNSLTCIPSYQTKWNSILQEEMLPEILPLLATDSMTEEQFVQKEDESVERYNMEK